MRTIKVIQFLGGQVFERRVNLIKEEQYWKHAPNDTDELMVFTIEDDEEILAVITSVVAVIPEAHDAGASGPP